MQRKKITKHKFIKSARHLQTYLPPKHRQTTLDQMNRYIDQVAHKADLKVNAEPDVNEIQINKARRISVQESYFPGIPTSGSGFLSASETGRSFEKVEEIEWTELRPKHGPEGRAHHTATLVDREVFLVGGRDLSNRTFNDMWKYSVFNREWKKVEQEGKVPGKVSNHTAVLLKGAIFLYGGLMANNTQNDHIYSFEIERSIWRLVRTYGTIPKARDDHGAVSDGANAFYIFGGFTGNLKNDELWRFSLDSQSWKQYKQDMRPCPRSGHTLVRRDKWVYLFGGCDEDGGRLRDLWRFKIGIEQWEWMSIMQGTIPKGRSGHSAVVLENKMLIFGGMHGVLHQNNELFVLDLDTFTWTQLCKQKLCTTPSAFMARLQTPVLNEHRSHGMLQSSPGQYSGRGSHFFTKTLNSFSSSPMHKSTKQIIKQSYMSPGVPNMKASKQRVVASSVMKIAAHQNPSPNASLSNRDSFPSAYLKVGKGNGLGSTNRIHRQTLNTSSAKQFKRGPHHGHHSYISRLLTAAELNEPGFKLNEPTMEAMKTSYLFRNVSTSKGQYKRRKLLWTKDLEHSALNDLFHRTGQQKAMALPGRRPPAREGHTATIISGNEMLVFGGDRNRMSFNDLYIFDGEVKKSNQLGETLQNPLSPSPILQQ